MTVEFIYTVFLLILAIPALLLSIALLMPDGKGVKKDDVAHNKR